MVSKPNSGQDLDSWIPNSDLEPGKWR